MQKNNLTALLTDLRALILKSRPAYRDFLGEVTEAKTTKILENVVLAEGQMMLSVADAAFSGFIAGRAYRVVLNGKEENIIAKDVDSVATLSNVEDISNLPSDYWVLMNNPEAGKMVSFTAGSFLGATISVYYDETVTEQRWSVKKLAYELLPDRLLSALSAAANTARKALTAANAAQSTANAAQTTANAAQTTANAAQTTANAAQSILGDVSTGKEQAEILLTFDKQTSGRDSFVFNGFNYYKFSEFSPAPVDVIDFSGTIANGATSSEIVDGENCRRYGLFIMVEKAGACTLPITSTFLGSFTAPSVGLYAKYKSGNDWQTAETAKFTYLCANLLVKSPTGKNFRITVDDTGTLSATEVTNTTT